MTDTNGEKCGQCGWPVDAECGCWCPDCGFLIEECFCEELREEAWARQVGSRTNTQEVES